MIDSINTLPPNFGPQFPVYPEIVAFVRTISPALAGNVYPGLTQQAVIAGNVPVFRDREPCYLFEPNGAILGAGFYEGRLIGSYLSAPLYATYCCPTGGSSASSSSSSANLCVNCKQCAQPVSSVWTIAWEGNVATISWNPLYAVENALDCAWTGFDQEGRPVILKASGSGWTVVLPIDGPITFDVWNCNAVNSQYDMGITVTATPVYSCA